MAEDSVKVPDKVAEATPNVANETTSAVSATTGHANVPGPLTPAHPVTKKAKKRSKWFLPAIIAGAVLVLAGGGSYGYFGVYMQTPENIWKQAMKNTGGGFRSYVNQPMDTNKATKIKGSFKVSTPIAADGTIEGSSDEKNAQLTANAGVAGVRATLEMRAITAEGATNPDVYVKAGGLKTVAALAGGDASEFGSIINQVDEQWFMIDRTLLDQATAAAMSSTTDTKMPSNEDIIKELEDISKKLSTVLSDRLFTVDDAKATVVVKETLAKEDFKGRKSQHYKVQVRKDQLKDLIRDMRGAVKGTETEKLFLQGFDEGFKDAGGDANGAPTSLEDILKELDKLNFDNATADVWVDTSLKYVRNVRITNTDKKTGDVTTIDFTLDFKGTNELPLSITIANKTKKDEVSVSLGMLLDQKSTAIKFTAGLDGVFDGQKVQFTADLGVTSTNEKVTVTKPDGAKNIMELLGSLSTQIQQLQSQFGSFQTRDNLTESTPDCASQYEQYANTNGTSQIDAACTQGDDTEI